MALTVTLEVPDKIARNAQLVAARTQRSLPEVLLQWLTRASDEIPVSDLPDEQVVSLTRLELDPLTQSELSELLARNREDTLDDAMRLRLDQLLEVYRHNLLRKSEAFKVAVERGLIEPLSEIAT